jgi:hypothetical protein
MSRSRNHTEQIRIVKRINYLKRAIEVQEIVKLYGKNGKGYPHTWIFKNVINAPGSGFHMSYSTFNNCIYQEAARTELQRLEQQLNKCHG